MFQQPPQQPLNPQVEDQRQLERNRALREQQERMRDTRMPEGPSVATARLPDNESPCVRIDRIVLRGDSADAFAWAVDAAAGPMQDDSPIGRCLGDTGIERVITRMQQAVVARGFVTTRLVAASNALQDGTLGLDVVPGRIAAIRFADDQGAARTIAGAMPSAAGDILQLRDLEQGVENLRRPPTVDATLRIEPAKATGETTETGPARGESDVIVELHQQMPLRLSLSYDDSGTRATGKNQLNTVLAWDGPLGLSDLFYASLGRDAFNHDGQGTRSETVHYDVPFGYWLLGATASRNRQHQTLQIGDSGYVYSGETTNDEVKLSRLVYRDQTRKTTLSLRAFRQTGRTDLADQEIEVQRRVVGGWEAGIAHREFIGEATADGALAYRRGTGAFGSIPAAGEAIGEGTSRFVLTTADLALNLPFSIDTQKLRYFGAWRAQWNATPLAPQDRFALGGRYTVRGFDGEVNLLGDRGWTLRNDLGWRLGATGAEAYLGVDVGRVGGPSTKALAGRTLSGAVIGVRGAVQKMVYDVFVGTPLAKPEGFVTAKTTAGFSLNYNF